MSILCASVGGWCLHVFTGSWMVQLLSACMHVAAGSRLRLAWWFAGACLLCWLRLWGWNRWCRWRWWRRRLWWRRLGFVGAVPSSCRASVSLMYVDEGPHGPFGRCFARVEMNYFECEFHVWVYLCSVVCCSSLFLWCRSGLWGCVTVDTFPAMRFGMAAVIVVACFRRLRLAAPVPELHPRILRVLAPHSWCDACR